MGTPQTLWVPRGACGSACVTFGSSRQNYTVRGSVAWCLTVHCAVLNWACCAVLCCAAEAAKAQTVQEPVYQFHPVLIENRWLWQFLHSVLMLLSFCFLLPLGSLLARHKVCHRVSTLLHSIMGYCTAAVDKAGMQACRCGSGSGPCVASCWASTQWGWLQACRDRHTSSHG